jgi:hypothetical protein
LLYNGGKKLVKDNIFIFYQFPDKTGLKPLFGILKKCMKRGISGIECSVTQKVQQSLAKCRAAQCGAAKLSRVQCSVHRIAL